MELRKAVVADQFYPAEKAELIKCIKETFTHTLGPGLAEESANKQVAKMGVLGVISPHAGYMYSGMCAAHSFHAIKESCFDPETGNDIFIIMGFSHSGLDAGGTGTIALDWETPLGRVACDRAMIKELLSGSGRMIREDIVSLSNEHSIEVQLPYLQYLYSRFSFVPLSVPHHCNFTRLAEIINLALKKTGRRACIIASSDFTHYGSGFSYEPFKGNINKNIKENLEELDKGAISHITSLDTAGFLSYVQKTGATICGTSPIALMLEMLKAGYNTAGHNIHNIHNENKGKDITSRLLSYYTSGDLTGDYSHCVSYASIVFCKERRE
ncbi:AmmeMemoRadiSam system protein B [Candidatus Woesearchaeota archaeon]|nr:AmmeMemoRadiSam system protein B [Candidatus Woesearchaeota archaeon]